MENELRIDDVFSFEDGRTVFAGKLLRESDYIRACDAELVVERKTVGTIHLEDEMMPLNSPDKAIRSVSTMDCLEIEIDRLKNGNSVLRWREPASK